MPRLTRRVAVMGLTLSVAACAVDLRRLPADQWSTRAALTVVRAYQRTLSPLMPSFGVRCRFTPTCSRYAEAVLSGYGVPRGAWLALERLARCGPWTKAGTVDPPPTPSRIGPTRPGASPLEPRPDVLLQQHPDRVEGEDRSQGK